MATILRMDENVFRGPEKFQSKADRKPLGDVTNSSKLLGRDKSSAKAAFNVFKGPEKVQPKTGRKPLGDLTNSTKPRAQQKASKKNGTAKLSAVREEQNYSWVKEEAFLHNHDECIKAQRQANTMSMDYFLETVGLKRDSSAPMSASQIPQVPKAFELECETPMELSEFEVDMLDICAPPTPPSPKSPGSPYSNMDWNSLDLSPLKLKDSPVRN